MLSFTIEVPDGKEYKEETVTVTLGKSEDTECRPKDSQNQDGATDEDGNLLEEPGRTMKAVPDFSMAKAGTKEQKIKIQFEFGIQD